MAIEEFNEQVKRSEEGNEIIFDVRPFGARRGEAVDSYLHDRMMVLRMTGIGACRAAVQFHSAASLCYGALAQKSKCGRARGRDSAVLVFSRQAVTVAPDRKHQAR